MNASNKLAAFAPQTRRRKLVDAVKQIKRLNKTVRSSFNAGSTGLSAAARKLEDSIMTDLAALADHYDQAVEAIVGERSRGAPKRVSLSSAAPTSFDRLVSKFAERLPAQPVNRPTTRVARENLAQRRRDARIGYKEALAIFVEIASK